ncbi:MAG: protein-glutamate O-methyltransferase CheR [Pirellulales bacterium]|nr:protein-glutamate O-methyltransferase CheR [Pirellulales bacterium]
MQVTDSQLSLYSELIYDRTGIRISAQKKTLLSNRVRRRLRETGIKDFGDYLNHLKQLRSNDPEWDAFLQEITTHETYLFRDETQWEWFCSYLKQRSSAAGQGKEPKRLRIWSAACSTGDEACTIACCIVSHLPSHKQWDIKILGTDIGIGAVKQAKQAVFGQRAMRLVPKNCMHCFQKSKDGHIWHAKPILTDMMSFRQHNLMDRVSESQFDIVFLKNVLIYFDATSKRQVIDNVQASIRPGGLLVAGAAEGVADMVKNYTRIQPWLFQRPRQ